MCDVTERTVPAAQLSREVGELAPETSVGVVHTGQALDNGHAPTLARPDCCGDLVPVHLAVEAKGPNGEETPRHFLTLAIQCGVSRLS